MSEQATGLQSYDPIYFPLLFQIEDRHFWFRGRNLAIAAMLKRFLPDPPTGYRVLEFGCGTGNALRVLEDLGEQVTVVGMDLFGEGLPYARSRTRADLVQGDLHNPPTSTGCFDLVALFDVLEHIPDDNQALRDLKVLLADGGTLILTVPAHSYLWSYFDEASHHFRRYEKGELLQKLKATGLQVEGVTYFMTCLLPIVWLGRRLRTWLSRQIGTRDRPASSLVQQELRIVPVVNDILTFLLTIESRIIAQRGVLPWGASLMVVARAVKD